MNDDTDIVRAEDEVSSSIDTFHRQVVDPSTSARFLSRILPVAPMKAWNLLGISSARR